MSLFGRYVQTVMSLSKMFQVKKENLGMTMIISNPFLLFFYKSVAHMASKILVLLGTDFTFHYSETLTNKMAIFLPCLVYCCCCCRRSPHLPTSFEDNHEIMDDDNPEAQKCLRCPSSSRAVC